jgi:nucleoside phosphorylase
MSQSHIFNDAQIGALTFGERSPATGSVNVVPAPERRAKAEPPHRTLIIVATNVERVAVTAEVRAFNRTEPTPMILEEETVLWLGTIGGTEILLAQVGPGTVTPDSAGPAAAALVREARPAQVYLTGICYGLKNDDPCDPQRLGDVVVATQVKLVGHIRKGEVERNRGGEVHPSPALLGRLRVASDRWRTAPVHTGPILSESVLLDNAGRRAELKRLYPEAIAGEMEGAGIYTAALRSKADWALVKGICDWGHGKGDDHQQQAAQNAAAFLVYTLTIGEHARR